MINRYFVSQPLRHLLPLAALALAGCQSETVPGPDPGADYYPLAVGSYRIYAVADTTWSNYQRTPTSYQFRETILDQITDATGQPSYRVVRAKRVAATDIWRDDSVMVIKATSKAVLLTRNNRRTVELVFPVRADYVWNMNAFVSINPFESQDTVTAETRRYEKVAEPFQVSTGGKTYRYEQTATTALVDDGFNGQDNEVYRSSYDQVYAKGVGPVYRARRRYTYCADQDVGTPICGRSNTRIYKGQARVEIMIEQGKL